MPTSTDAKQTLHACQGAKLLSDPLDLRGALLARLAQLGELRPARLVVGEELLRERAGLDLAEDVAQPLLHALVHDARAARQVAVLGDVGDGIAHVLLAAL